MAARGVNQELFHGLQRRLLCHRPHSFRATSISCLVRASGRRHPLTLRLSSCEYFSTFTHDEIVSRNQQQQTEERRRLDIAIVGLPNAGKSQILNRLTGASISAVSQKRHTTVQGILAAKTQGNTQLVFLDTPGFLRKGDEGGTHVLSTTPSATVDNVDLTLIVVDAARKLTDDIRQALIQLMLLALQSNGRRDFESDGEDNDDAEEIRAKFAIVLNKADLVYPKTQLLDLAMELSSLAKQCLFSLSDPSYSTAGDKSSTTEKETVDDNDETIERMLPTFFYVSAKKLNDKGMDDLLQFLLEEATECDEWELEPEEQTLMTPEERVEEVVREKLYRYTHQELPYQLKQDNRLFRVIPLRDDKFRVVVHQDILVSSKSQQAVVRGKGNRTLDHIRRKAQHDLEKAFHCPVDLQLYVKLVKTKHGRWSIE